MLAAGPVLADGESGNQASPSFVSLLPVRVEGGEGFLSASFVLVASEVLVGESGGGEGGGEHGVVLPYRLAASIKNCRLGIERHAFVGYTRWISADF